MSGCDPSTGGPSWLVHRNSISISLGYFSPHFSHGLSSSSFLKLTSTMDSRAPVSLICSLSLLFNSPTTLTTPHNCFRYCVWEGLFSVLCQLQVAGTLEGGYSCTFSSSQFLSADYPRMIHLQASLDATVSHVAFPFQDSV